MESGGEFARENHPEAGHQEIGTAETFLEPVGDKSSQQRREKSGHNRDAAKDRGRLGRRLIAKNQVSRHPKREAAQRKGHRGLSQAIENEGAGAQQRHIVLPGGAFSFLPDAGSCARVRLEETKQT